MSGTVHSKAMVFMSLLLRITQWSTRITQIKTSGVNSKEHYASEVSETFDEDDVVHSIIPSTEHIHINKTVDRHGHICLDNPYLSGNWKCHSWWVKYKCIKIPIIQHGHINQNKLSGKIIHQNIQSYRPKYSTKVSTLQHYFP